MILETYRYLKNILGEINKRRYFRINHSSCSIDHPITIVNIENLTLGKNLTIGAGCYIHCGGYKWSNFNGHIKIGDNTNIGQNVLMYGAGKIMIENNVEIAPGCKIYSSSVDHKLEFAHDTEKKYRFETVEIGSNAILFSNVVISPGVKVGEGAIIGAGSIVLSDVPPWSMYAGNPAKLIKKRK